MGAQAGAGAPDDAATPPMGQRFHYALGVRVSMLLSALLCLIMAGGSLALPWTALFVPLDTSPDLAAILVSMLVFSPMACYFLHRCNQFWGWLAVDESGLTVRTLLRRWRLSFADVVSVSIAEGHELSLVSRNLPRELEIQTQYLGPSAQRFVDLVKAGLSPALRRQNEEWDQGGVTAECSARGIREGWYFVAVVNGIAWVVGGSFMLRHFDDPLRIGLIMTGLAVLLTISVILHQRYYTRRFTLTSQGLAIWSALGAEYVAYDRIRVIAIRQRRGHGTLHMMIAIQTPGRRWTIGSNWRNVEALTDRLVKRSAQAQVLGARPLDAPERWRRLDRRALNAPWFWALASLFIGALLIGWGLMSLHERWRMVRHGTTTPGVVQQTFQRGGDFLVQYEYALPGPATLGARVYHGEARVRREAFEAIEDGSVLQVYYDPRDPARSLVLEEIDSLFNWVLVGLGGALYVYAIYQMFQVYRRSRVTV